MRWAWLVSSNRGMLPCCSICCYCVLIFYVENRYMLEQTFWRHILIFRMIDGTIITKNEITFFDVGIFWCYRDTIVPDTVPREVEHGTVNIYYPEIHLAHAPAVHFSWNLNMQYKLATKFNTLLPWYTKVRFGYRIYTIHLNWLVGFIQWIIRLLAFIHDFVHLLQIILTIYLVYPSIFIMFC